MGGCDVERSYLNGPDASSFPASKAEVEAGVFAIYKGLTNFYASGTPYPGVEDNATDIGASRVNVAAYNDQIQSKIALNNSIVTKYYEYFYKTIDRKSVV